MVNFAMSEEAKPWRIEMLGTFRISTEDRTVERFQTQKTASLLARLAMPPLRSYSREELIDLLWPDAEVGAGRNRLSQALGWLRAQAEQLGSASGSIFSAERQMIRLNPDCVRVDVAEFDSLINAAATGADDEFHFLARAVDLYRGDLLPGFYDAWALSNRSRLLAAFIAVERRLIKHFEEVEDWDVALAHARRVVDADGLDEQAHCDLIRILAESGQTAAARRQFKELERILAQELEEVPSASVQALIDEVIRKGPKLSAVDAAPTNIPVSLTRFIGRRAEIQHIYDLITSDGLRLISLTGTGGSGKTRLALEAARRLLSYYRNAVWFVPLADLTDPQLLGAVIADVMHLPRGTTLVPLQYVTEVLSRKPCVLILDNAEHLIDGLVPIVRSLLEHAPSLTVVSTTRQRLGIDGEREVDVPPLPIPSEQAIAPPGPAALDELLDVDSVSLFVDRARNVSPAFVLTASNAQAISELCRRLDGLPLAIELCAAWAQTLTPGQMLTMLTRRFDFLVSRRTDILPRHRSLRAAVEYSYILLPTALQQLFEGLSVFRGGWTLASAAAVCGTESAHQLDLVTALTELRECSLIIAEEADVNASDDHTDSAMRYRMLEALREFAAEQRTLSVDVPLRLRHAEFFLDLAEQAAKEIAGPDQAAWLNKLQSEHDNFRAVLEWSIETENFEMGLRLAAALSAFWEVRGFVTEGADWLARLLRQAGSASRRPGILLTRASALDALALMARACADFSTADKAAHEALALWRGANDPHKIVLSLQFLSTIAYSREDYPEAARLLDEGLKLAAELDDPLLLARILNSQGNVAMETHDWPRAEANFSESLTLHRKLNDKRRIASTLNNLGLVARYCGDMTKAKILLEEDLVLCRDLSDRSGVAIALLNIATVSRLAGRLDDAGTALYEALGLASNVHNRRAVAWCIKETGHLMCAKKSFAIAVKILAASESLRTTIGISFKPADPGELNSDSSAARSAIGIEKYDVAWTEGSSLTYDQTVAEALNALGSSNN
jgi:predicted ATPase/DNA-binding SARP family transcriptional activator